MTVRGFPPAAPEVLRVASVPTAHPYVAHLGLERVGIRLLEDPVPDGAAHGRWWPPVILDPRWIAGQAETFDLLHIHFGFEQIDPAVLRGTLDAVHAAGRSCVVTVHDLENPQLADQRGHRERLGVLLARADAVITLTDGCAREIERTWRRVAAVIPHPHMLVAPRPCAPRAGMMTVVGLPLRDLRPNIEPRSAGALITAMGRLRSQCAEIRGEVELRARTRDPGTAAKVLEQCRQSPGVRVRTGDRLDDSALAAWLGGLTACILPYRHGTHSGWLELCWDLGVPVIAPRIGYLAEQHPETDFFHVADIADGASIAAAIRSLSDVRHCVPQSSRDRERGSAARRIAAEHRRVYEDALGARRAYLPRNSISASLNSVTCDALMP